MVRSESVPGTSGGSAAFVGWLVAAGFCAMLVPVATLAAPMLGAPLMAIPFLIVLALAFLIGGYAAGALAGHHTGYHGLLMGVVALVVIGIVTVADAVGLDWLGANLAVTAGARPWVSGYGLFQMGFAGLAVVILSAWVGGLAAPSRVVSAAAVVQPTREVRTERVYRDRVVPQQAGAKGGERTDDDDRKG